MRVSYSISPGSWVQASIPSEPLSTFGLVSVNLPAAVNGQSDVGVRIEVRSWVNINERIEFDNVTLTANSVSTPGTLLLLTVAGTLTIRFRRRRANIGAESRK